MEIYIKSFLKKYIKIFQNDNESEFKSDVIKLLEKHNGDVRRTTRKYNHTHTAFVKAFDNYSSKQLFNSTDTQQLQDPEKISTICVKNLALQTR